MKRKQAPRARLESTPGPTHAGTTQLTTTIIQRNLFSLSFSLPWYIPSHFLFSRATFYLSPISFLPYKFKNMPFLNINLRSYRARTPHNTLMSPFFSYLFFMKKRFEKDDFLLYFLSLLCFESGKADV